MHGECGCVVVAFTDSAAQGQSDERSNWQHGEADREKNLLPGRMPRVVKAATAFA